MMGEAMSVLPQNPTAPSSRGRGNTFWQTSILPPPGKPAVGAEYDFGIARQPSLPRNGDGHGVREIFSGGTFKLQPRVALATSR